MVPDAALEVEVEVVDGTDDEPGFPVVVLFVVVVAVLLVELEDPGRHCE